MTEEAKNVNTLALGGLTTAAKVSAMAAKAQKLAQAKKNTVLAELYSQGQLVLWEPEQRGMPNELVRCALFPAKNHSEKRAMYPAKSPLIVPIIGGGKVIYFGEELRQDDETVWMQLVHLSKEARSEWVSFTPHSFIVSIKWSVSTESYKRLLYSIRRLAAGSIEVYSQRFDRGMKTQLVRSYEYSENETKPWRVRVFDRDDGLLFLFDKLYSRSDWATRLALPSGIATWLHGFFTSHKEPFAHKIETLAIGAGLKMSAPEDTFLPEPKRIAKLKQRALDNKKKIIRALESLQNSGFLRDFQVSKKNLVTVRRNGDERPIV